ncbi:cyanase [Mycetocola reblochoni]|uniref:Cyanate hydratase n=2 Tax=Mycetocola reblochoni TaxID=331618 RepID=A0A1R4IK38_9MICO|nr:cyanase [Mycetocola reblochoni]RLP67792.1 cyanase [Mycetocola reblochoni]SJN20187.1 Cyanate hydratase [Mycetocola reblochoni REB411]
MSAWNESKERAAITVRRRLAETGSSWQQLAEQLDRPLLWTIAALLGSHPVPAPLAARAGELLGLDDATVAALQEQPYRLTGDTLKADPTIYRFSELIAVYGPALKEAIHEEFGDGIMSAINCNVTLERRPHPDGDRVVVTIDGKFLPYQW